LAQQPCNTHPRACSCDAPTGSRGLSSRLQFQEAPVKECQGALSRPLKAPLNHRPHLHLSCCAGLVRKRSSANTYSAPSSTVTLPPRPHYRLSSLCLYECFSICLCLNTGNSSPCLYNGGRFLPLQQRPCAPSRPPALVEEAHTKVHHGLQHRELPPEVHRQLVQGRPRLQGTARHSTARQQRSIAGFCS
jgi:hypothetical protein